VTLNLGEHAAWVAGPGAAAYGASGLVGEAAASDLRVAVITATHVIFTVSLLLLYQASLITVNGGRDGTEDNGGTGR
jgi:hypothetical protein